MATSYKNKIYTTLGTPTNITTTLTPLSVSNSSGVPVKDYTVKGKSIVWNQLVKNGNFVDKTGWFPYNGTGLVSNNKYTLTAAGKDTYSNIIQYMDKSFFIAGHKYYITATITPQYRTGRLTVALHNGANQQPEAWTAPASSGKTNFVSTIFTPSSEFVSGAANRVRFVLYCPHTESAQGDVTEISNVWMVDLTKMFGAGNEPTAAQFRTMFPDDYYEYDAGTIKSIMPMSVEANSPIRFNLLDTSRVRDGGITIGVTCKPAQNKSIYVTGTAAVSGGRNSWNLFVNLIARHKYYSTPVNNMDGPFLTLNSQLSKYISGQFVTCDLSGQYRFGYNLRAGVTYDDYIYPVVVDLTEMYGAGNEPTIASAIPDFWGYNPDAYKSVNIPVETYFPDGFNSVGNVYDEISFSGQTATRRIGVRSYQDGDENESSVLTDKTNTLYVLPTPIITNIPQKLQPLPTYKGFTSFSAPNSLTQSGPFDLTYYAEGGTNPEKGWITTYKRKIPVSIPDIQNAQKRDNYPIKGQFTTTRGSESLTWDVLDYDKHELVDSDTTKTMCVGMHDIISYGTIPFCVPQLMYWSENGLPAGTYKLTLDHAQFEGGTLYDGTYMFTLTKAIPADGGFRHTKPVGGWQSSYEKADILGNYITTYGARPQRSEIESGVTFSEYDGTTECTDLGTFTARSRTYYTEDDTVNGGKRNFTERQAYGSNRWRDSVYRQWLNSDAEAVPSSDITTVSNWWKPATVFDRVPGGAKLAGFLNGLDPEFVSAIGKVKVITALCNCDKVDGATQDITYDKVWLQSMTEVFGNANNSISEGVRLAYWNGSTDADRIKYHNGTARYWWLRSPDPTGADRVLDVSPSGVVTNGEANSKYGRVPACCIKQYDGWRTIEWNQLRTDNGASGSVTTTRQWQQIGAENTSLVFGHKYLVSFLARYTEGNTNTGSVRFKMGHPQYIEFSFLFNPTTDLALYQTIGTLQAEAPTQTLRSYFLKITSNTETLAFEWKDLQIFDLTKMFAAGNEPTTPAEFWQYFDNKYYPYNAGEIQPLYLQSRKAVTYYTATTKQTDLLVDVPKNAHNVLDYSKFNPLLKDKYIISSTDKFIERTVSYNFNNSLFYPVAGNQATLPNVNNLLKFENQTVTFSLTSANTEVFINKYSSDGTVISTIVILSNARKSFTTTFSEITYIDIKANTKKPFYIRGLQVIAVNQNYVGLGDATSATILGWGGQSKVINGTLYSGSVTQIRVDSDNLITPLVNEVTQTTDKPTEIESAATMKIIAKEHPNPIDVCFSLHTDGVEMNDSTKNNRIGLYSSYVSNGTTYWRPDCWRTKSSVTGTNDINAFSPNSWPVPYSDENVYTQLRFTTQGLTGGAVTAKNFALYENKQRYAIPTTVTSLPGYGIGIGDICNSVERYESGWRYVQRASSVRFTTDLLETASETGTTTIDGKTVAWARNIQFPDSGVSRSFNGSDGWANISALGDVIFNGTKYNSTQYRMFFMNYSSIEDVKTALGTDGILFHYQIAKPVITDISDKLADSFLKDISVIPGGKVVMYNNNLLDVPSTVKWKM